jgi:hypothetical protein
MNNMASNIPTSPPVLTDTSISTISGGFQGQSYKKKQSAAATDQISQKLALIQALQSGATNSTDKNLTPDQIASSNAVSAIIAQYKSDIQTLVSQGGSISAAQKQIIPIPSSAQATNDLGSL